MSPLMRTEALEHATFAGPWLDGRPGKDIIT